MHYTVKPVKDPENILQTIMEMKYSSARHGKAITYLINIHFIVTNSVLTVNILASI